ncbi:uncharacterized protein LOC120437787 [Oreochromis aureus]|uniref:uncharacterized protein LOC120437787 n=1 Tax=Oreochromis aureus TaxID=47969 RepID=UPI0019535A54|nr:uncharacterized protein LOC120437787 [Oreochromis aureus]
MPDPATQKREIIQTVESLCSKWLQCSGEEEWEELARQVGVCTSVFPWLWEALHPLIIDLLVTALQLRLQPQLPSVRAAPLEPCCDPVSPLLCEPEAVRVGTVRLTTDTPSARASSASASSPQSSRTARRTETTEAIDFGEEERQQVLRAYREDELWWKLILEEELSPVAPPTSCSPSPPRSDFTSPASPLARIWAEGEIAATSPSVLVASVSFAPATRKKRRRCRHCTALTPLFRGTYYGRHGFQPP